MPLRRTRTQKSRETGASRKALEAKKRERGRSLSRANKANSANQNPSRRKKATL